MRNEYAEDRAKPNEKVDFDPDLSPYHPINQETASQEGLRYNPRRRAWVDEDGCLIRDEFGQPL